MSLEVLDLALDAISDLRPVVARIKRHDRLLAKQITLFVLIGGLAGCQAAGR